MKVKHKIQFIFLLTILTGSVYAQKSGKELNLVVDELYSVFNEGVRPGCAIAIVKEGEVIYQNCFGFSNIENQVSISDTTLFNLASVSKQFTGFAFAKLMHEGRINSDDFVSGYLVGENSLWESVKVGNLIHHSSGLWDWPYLFIAAGYSFNDVLSHESIYRMIKRQKRLNFPPGTKFQYASSNYILLGEIMSRVIDTSYFDWMRQNVFLPSGMSKTVFQENYSHIISNRAYGYLCKNNQYFRTSNNISPKGTGAIFSSITDMANWMKFLLEGDAQNDPIVKEMIQTDTLNNGQEIQYAYGLMKKGKNCYWHDGFFQGIRNLTVLYPKQNLGLIVLSNSGSNYMVRSGLMIAEMYANKRIPLDKVAKYKKNFQRELSRKVQGQSKPEFIELIQPKDYLGVFFNSDLMISFRISLKAGGLIAENSLDEIELTPQMKNPDLFSSSKFLLGDFKFIRGEKSVVKGLQIIQKRGNVIQFKKLEGESGVRR